MAGIVLELQKELLSSNCDIVSVLRKAHLIAVKLKLSDFDQWIQYELNGYTDQSECPEYRKLQGILKYYNQYHGWCSILIQNDELEKKICKIEIINSISEIMSLCKSSKDIMSEFHGKELDYINKLCNMPFPQRIALYVSSTAVKDIEEKVKKQNLENYVIFAGNRSDVNELYSAMNYFVFPSLYEGLPNTLIEAQANGLKCFASLTITEEANITNYVTFIELKNVNEWVKIIQKSSDERIDPQESFKKRRYTIDCVVSKYEEIFTS